MSEPVEIGRSTSFEAFGGQQIYPDRVTPLIEAARGKRVLNVGCAGSDALVAEKPVHAQIAEVSSYCFGIDIFEPGIKKFADDGFNVATADAEKLDLPEKNFEVATMGDVIEHVSNPGLVFDGVNRHLVMGGIAVVTTPNPFSLTLMLKRLGNGPYTVNSEHVTWFDPVLLSWLMERSGFGEFQVFWTEQSRIAPLRMMQKRTKAFHNTFGLIGKKIREL